MKILAIDYGEARTGFATCDKDEIIASPLCVIHERNFDKLIDKTVSLIEEHSIEEVVVGNPINMNGTKGEKSEKCELFAEKLRGRVGVSVVMRDERLTTVSAVGIMNENNRRGNKRKETIDAVAAALILEDYIGYRRNIKK
ncbi:MAG: Holliday junction resolvase RuvX [Oscillospiraceae bacterium]|nr:Holliday junction resolvase RuvX [Oscillospiraceae bacterium]